MPTFNLSRNYAAKLFLVDFLSYENGQMQNIPEPHRRRFLRCLHFSVPAAGLVSCLCGVVLVLSVFTTGVLSMGFVFIPVAVIGAITVLWLIVGGMIGSCIYQDTDSMGRPVTRIAMRRPTPGDVRRRADIVQSLPHVMAEGESDDRMCSICLSDTPPERVMLNCGHRFHENCIKDWMTRARFARCPLCRSGLSTPRPPIHQGDAAEIDHVV